MTTVHLVAAARPNFMKIAPLYHVLKREKWCATRIVHTGQHYDPDMSDSFFSDLELPSPDYNLEVGSGTQAEQTAGVMLSYERLCLESPPDWTIVVGDVNSTLACALAANKLHIRVCHLEAGLRSRDRTMPEEINRLLTDAIADVLWTSCLDANENLRREGIPDDRIEFVGNIMIDSYELLREKIGRTEMRGRHGLEAKSYFVATFHRPSNVDTKENLTRIVDVLCEVVVTAPLVFPIHPRTRLKLKEFDLFHRLEAMDNMHLTDPMGYVDFMSLVSEAEAVITDSGGIQEETTYLGIPCLTVRDTTERPITITDGTNRLVRVDDIMAQVGLIRAGDWPQGRRPALWDGQTARRVVQSLRSRTDAL